MKKEDVLTSQPGVLTIQMASCERLGTNARPNCCRRRLKTCKSAKSINNKEIRMNHKILLTILAAFLILSAKQATNGTNLRALQQKDTPPQTPQGETLRRPGGVDLTIDQKAQLKAIRQTTRQQMCSLRSDQTLTSEQRQAKASTLREATRQQILGVLTPQQQEIVGKNRKERAGHRRGEGRQRGLDRQEALGLTGDQRAQLKAIHENTRGQVGAIRNDGTLTPEQKMEKLRTLHQNSRQQVSTILTPEQQEKMRQQRQLRGGREGGLRGGRRDRLFGPKSDKP
jgi:Spy/CpxP family protein refolding chaperone